MPGGKVGSAKLLVTADIGTQGLDHSDSLFNSLASLCEIAAYLLDSRNPQQGSSFSGAFTYRLPERQSFIVLLQRLLHLSRRPVDFAEVVEDSSVQTAIA